MKEDRVQAPLPLPSADIASKVEVQPDEEKRVAAFPSAPATSKEKGNVKKNILPETKEAKVTDSVDKSQPIDITSDKVEAYWKENLVIFKGNVIARQKDMVIYADSVEVVTNEDGKRIERVIAGGNVKIQQGLRVAHCQKAVFYNLDQKLVLTGDPKVSEGDNIVLGDEIIFDIDKNRVEVKGGPSGRGKAKVQPGEIEKLK
jgi:lipopolysaccharide export system protein LptA